MSNRAMSYEIELIGGRYDGMAFPVPEKAYYGAVCFLCEPRQPVKLDAKTTDDGWEGHFYYPQDFAETGPLAEFEDVEDETVYHKCVDSKWRPLRLKRALGL